MKSQESIVQIGTTQITPDSQGKRLPTVSFDIDGVFANFIQAFLDKLTERTGLVYSWRDMVDYHPVKAGLLNDEEYVWTWDNVMRKANFWSTIEPFDDIDFDYLDTLMETGQMVGYFVTRRAHLHTPHHIGDARYLTASWLKRQGIVNSTAVLAGYFDRLELLRLLDVDYHLEDYDVEFKRLRAEGINAYLIDRPWNRQVQTEYRVKTIEEFLQKTVFAKSAV